MKSLVPAALALSIALTGSTAAASHINSLEFSSAELAVNIEKYKITYADFDQLRVGQFSLPLRQYLISLENSSNISSISVIVSEAEIIAGLTDLSIIQSDLTTSDDPNEYEIIRPATVMDGLGQKAFEISLITIANQRYALLSVFPVSLDSASNFLFNKSFQIEYDGALLSESQLTANSSLSLASLSDKFRSNNSLSNNNAEYLIVTSQFLLPDLQLLADYKNKTGIVTKLETIEDVLASYAGSGVDDAEKLRSRLKDFHYNGGKYLLLAGDETVLPVRYAFHYDIDTLPDMKNLQLTDLYFADLEVDWDNDHDGIWGEKLTDLNYLTPELLVGRLPFNSSGHFSAYINKLIKYETNPGNGDFDYLTHSFFFSSDQMRDFSGGGQHRQIAQAYPDYFLIDTVNGVESFSGGDPEPTNVPAASLVDILSGGFNLVNIIAHGKSNAFAVKTANYNNWPKSYFLSSASGSNHANFADLAQNNKTGLYYSLSCNIGGFDLDQPPVNDPNLNITEQLLSLENRGAVAVISYSRWGWVSSSYHLQKAFFDSLFAHPELPATAAMYASKLSYHYYRDLNFGQNFYGDPTLKLFIDIPIRPELSVQNLQDGIRVSVSVGSSRLSGVTVVLSADNQLIGRYITDQNGEVNIVYPFDPETEYAIVVNETGLIITEAKYLRGVATSIEEDRGGLPKTFSLYQNYPNPFNPSTTISFDLPRKSGVTLSIFNITGRKVATIVERELPAGQHKFEWKGLDHTGHETASGIYFYKLESENFRAVKKMLLLR